MTRHSTFPEYEETMEYHGNTSVEITRKQGGDVVWKDWLLFDSPEEAGNYFFSSLD